MPTLVLKPFYEIPITVQQEKEILKFLESDEVYTRVNKTTITKQSISYIKPGGYTEVDRSEPIDPSRRLKSDNRSDEEQYKAARAKVESIRETLKKKSYSKLNQN